MIKSEQINELAAALSKAQGEMKGAAKDSSNPFFKSKYADLSSVWEAFREPFAKQGLSVSQFPKFVDGLVSVETLLLHSSGQWLQGEVSAAPKDQSPQAIGSTITYLRRYGAQSIAGVCPEDDDGNAWSQTHAPKVTIATNIKNAVYEQARSCLSKGDAMGLQQVMDEFDADEKVVLWGMFNSQERTAMKALLK